MNKILNILLAALLLSGISCKKGFLDVQSDAAVDQDFVFSSSSETFKVLAGCYDLWRGAYGGLYYDIDVVGSDAETHPESYDAQLRHVPEGLYASEISIDFADAVNAWTNLYRVANRANIIMEAIAAKPEYQAAVTAGKPNDWTQLYGEAAIFRAFSYFTLVRYYGDVPYFKVPISQTSQVDSAKLTSRDLIYDGEIESLLKIETLMYRLGEGGINAERFSRTFALGLAGKMALFAGGYSTRRTDFDYGSVTFTQIGSEKWNAKYVRRTDYKKYYEIAKTSLKAAIDNQGSAYLITADTRGAGYGNPFQLNFQFNMNLVASPESLFESGDTQGQTSERPYAFGRPSNGGSANSYPNKAYGQSRMHPAFYYGDYDPKDMRRDVTVTVSANSGTASETIIDFAPGSRSAGGLANNKWDESRMPNPYIVSQRNAGVNWVQMRMGDVVLMLAEAYAELGDDGAAKVELRKIRSRSFAAADQTDKVTNYLNALAGDALKDAIQQERKLELAGEGFRRDDLIRTGKLPAKIKELRDAQIAMVAGLKARGYYTFPNGNTISNYIYTKSVNIDSLGLTKMLMTQNTVAETDSKYPVTFPGWRGNSDAWTALGYTTKTGLRNLAIKGLFNYIDPAGAEAATLVAQGYKKVNWGANIIANEGQYTTSIFKGYPDAFYAAGAPPRYLLPLSSETVSKSNGLIKNGYGFQ